MTVELCVVLETLENVVSWIKSFDSTVDNSLEIGVFREFDFSIFIQLLVQVFEP